MPHKHHAIIKGFRAAVLLKAFGIGAIPLTMAAIASVVEKTAMKHEFVQWIMAIVFLGGFGWFIAFVFYAVLRLQPQCPECDRRMRSNGPHNDEQGHWTIANCLNCRKFYRYRGFGNGIGLD